MVAASSRLVKEIRVHYFSESMCILVNFCSILLISGLVTFSDGTHGLPRNEGLFDGNKMTRREKCPHVIRKAQDAAVRAKDNRR